MSKQLRNFVFTWNNPYGEKIGTLEAAHDKNGTSARIASNSIYNIRSRKR